MIDAIFAGYQDQGYEKYATLPIFNVVNKETSDFGSTLGLWSIFKRKLKVDKIMLCAWCANFKEESAKLNALKVFYSGGICKVHKERAMRKVREEKNHEPNRASPVK